jgi:hypothetical protein
MINAKMKEYYYFLYGELDGYGQPQLSDEIKGSVRMAIHTTSQAIQDNIRYKDATYVGLTHSSLLDDNCVIQYGEEKLKVLYVNSEGRLNQVFMKNL